MARKRDLIDDEAATDSDAGLTPRPQRRRIRQGPTVSSSDNNSSGGEESDASQRSNQQQRQRREPTLVATSESVKLLVTLLNCLASPGKKEQRIRCDIDANGILFTAHSKGKSLQIKTSLSSELFETYKLAVEREPGDDADGDNGDDDEDDDEQLSFALNLNTLIECLSIFGSSALATTSLRMSYLPQSASLLLVVEDSGVICECSMQVLEHDGNDVGQLEFESAFENSAVVGRCIIQSEPLHDAFAELYDLPSAASVTIAMFGKEDPTGRRAFLTSDNNSNSDSMFSRKCLSLSATSETGSCEIEFGVTSRAFIEFFCAAAGSNANGNDAEGGDSGGNKCAATFHVAVLQQAFKALAHSNETFLRMNADGFLSVQHMVESGTGEKAFVDALISPEDASVQWRQHVASPSQRAHHERRDRERQRHAHGRQQLVDRVRDHERARRVRGRALRAVALDADRLQDHAHVHAVRDEHVGERDDRDREHDVRGHAHGAVLDEQQLGARSPRERLHVQLDREFGVFYRQFAVFSAW